MNTVTERKNKHLILSQTKINLAKKILGAKTETETIELALDSVITEEGRCRDAANATENFLRNNIEIEDVFGNLDE